MSEYWTVSRGRANHTGHTCRECRGTIFTNEPVCVRDGRKIRLFYHRKCYSGDADPRTQAGSSFRDKSLGIREKAPGQKGRGKWWTSEFGYRGDGHAPLQNLACPALSEALRRPTSVLLRKGESSSTPAMVVAGDHTDASQTKFEQAMAGSRYNINPYPPPIFQFPGVK